MDIQYQSKIVALVSTITGTAISLGFFLRSWGTFDLVGLGFATWVLSPWLLLGAALGLSWRKSSPVKLQAFLSILFLILSTWGYYQTLIAHYDAQAELIFVVIPMLALPPTLVLLFCIWFSNRKAVDKTSAST